MAVYVTKNWPIAGSGAKHTDLISDEISVEIGEVEPVRNRSAELDHETASAGQEDSRSGRP
jgi:hypothetical protein